ncbi:MAG: hypothetical protein P1U74_04610 [Legionellaceae bacterium]|nr:hypothetical protein [Legionellaceae bacterium]
MPTKNRKEPSRDPHNNLEPFRTPSDALRTGDSEFNHFRSSIYNEIAQNEHSGYILSAIEKKKYFRKSNPNYATQAYRFFSCSNNPYFRESCNFQLSDNRLKVTLYYDYRSDTRYARNFKRSLNLEIPTENVLEKIHSSKVNSKNQVTLSFSTTKDYPLEEYYSSSKLLITRSVESNCIGGSINKLGLYNEDLHLVFQKDEDKFQLSSVRASVYTSTKKYFNLHHKNLYSQEKYNAEVEPYESCQRRAELEQFSDYALQGSIRSIRRR